MKCELRPLSIGFAAVDKIRGRTVLSISPSGEDPLLRRTPLLLVRGSDFFLTPIIKTICQCLQASDKTFFIFADIP
jgi:hypothetical protein